MADKTTRYTQEFKRQLVALVGTGRTPASLAKEFGPSAWTIGLWVKQAEHDSGSGGGLSSSEREELMRLRRENRRLKEERDILSKAAAWFATENGPSKRSSGS